LKAKSLTHPLYFWAQKMQTPRQAHLPFLGEGKQGNAIFQDTRIRFSPGAEAAFWISDSNGHIVGDPSFL
jgi:hypothetical protein